MARGTAERIGRLLDDLRRGINQTETYQTLKNVIATSGFGSRKRRLLNALAYDAFTRAGVMAYYLQAAILREVVTAVPPSTLTSLRDRALIQVGTVVDSFVALRDTVPLDPQRTFLTWLETTVDTAIRNGKDIGLDEAANNFDAGFKTWVRTGPALELRAHSDLQGVTLPRSELFTLPSGSPNAGFRVARPRDPRTPNWPAEWVHCHHSLVYSREARAADLAAALTPRGTGRRVERGVIRRR